MQQIIPFIILISVFVLLVSIIRNAKRRRNEFRQGMQRLGYNPQEQFDPQLQEKLTNLLRKHANVVRFKNIYAYSRMNFTFYRFDVNRGNENHPAYAVVARGIHLPHVAIIPKVDLPGLLGKMWMRMLKFMAGGRNFSEVRLPDNSPFTKKYYLFAADPITVQEAIPHSVWEKLAALPQSLMIDVVDDLIVFQELAVTAKQKRALDPNSIPQLKAAMDLAGRIYDCLRDARPLPTTQVS